MVDVYWDGARKDHVCALCEQVTDLCQCHDVGDSDLCDGCGRHEDICICDEAFAAIVDRAKREVLADIAAGRVPASVATFGELHDYVDANEYGGFCAELESGVSWWDGSEKTVEDSTAFANRVQNVVHIWLCTGRPMDKAPDRIRSWVARQFNAKHVDRVTQDLIDVATGNRTGNAFEVQALERIFPDWPGPKS